MFLYGGLQFLPLVNIANSERKKEKKSRWKEIGFISLLTLDVSPRKERDCWQKIMKTPGLLLYAGRIAPETIKVKCR